MRDAVLSSLTALQGRGSAVADGIEKNIDYVFEQVFDGNLLTDFLDFSELDIDDFM